MLKEDDLDPNGQLFDETLEGGNGGLGNGKFVIAERDSRSS